MSNVLSKKEVSVKFTINKVFKGQDPNEIITTKAATERSMFENLLKA